MALHKFRKLHYTLSFTEINIQNGLVNKINKLLDCFIGFLLLFPSLRKKRKIKEQIFRMTFWKYITLKCFIYLKKDKLYGILFVPWSLKSTMGRVLYIFHLSLIHVNLNLISSIRDFISWRKYFSVSQ